MSYQQVFSNGQIFLPDTIKVFRVYKDQLTDKDGNRKLDLSENGIYGKYDSTTGLYANEDTAFENYLKDHMYNAVNQQVSYNDFVNASKQNQPIPVVNTIKFNEDGKFGDGSNDWSKNGGTNGENNNNTVIHNPHSTFLIQMDTLLSTNIPASWTKPGDDPSSTITIPNNPHAVVTSDSTTGNTSTYIGFNNGGSGFINNIKFTANLYFADVTTHKDIKDLGRRNITPLTVKGANEENATLSTPIRFNNIESIIENLNKSGYAFIGAYTGKHVSGKYTNSILYSSKNYEDDKYGNYDWEGKDFTLNFVKLDSQKKNVSDSVKYIYENGPKKGQEVESKYAKPSSQSLTFNQTQIVDDNGNVVYPSTWLAENNNGKFDVINIPTDVNGNTKYSIDYDNITLNNEKLSALDKSVSVDRKKNIITITIDKDTIPDKIRFDLVVPYKLIENIRVHYIDEDIKGGSEINHALNIKVDDSKLHTFYSGDPETTTANLTHDTINYLEALNYILDIDATNDGKAHTSIPNYDSSKLNFNDQVNKYTSDKLTFDDDEDPNDQVYYVYLYHKIKEDKLRVQQKQIEEVIHYVDEDNAYDKQRNLKDLATPYISDTLTFSRDANVDQVTGKTVSWNNWSIGTFDSHKNASAFNYTIDLGSKIFSQKLNGKAAHLADITSDQVSSINVFANKDAQKEIDALPKGKSLIEIVIPYKHNAPKPEPPKNPGDTPSTPTNVPDTPPAPSNPVIPSTSTPSDNPTTPTTPNIPSVSNSKKTNNKPTDPKLKVVKTNSISDNHANSKEPKGVISTSSNNLSRAEKISSNSYALVYSTNQIVKSTKKQNILPQTGESKSELGIIGLGLALVGSLVGLVYRKRKE